MTQPRSAGGCHSPARAWRNRVALLALLAGLQLGGVAAHAQHHDHEAKLDFNKAPAGTLLWAELAKAHAQVVDGKYVRTFTAPVRAYDGKQVTLYGYLTPVDSHPEQRQSLFLVSSQRIVCGGCPMLEPEGIVEVNLKRPVDLRALLKVSDVVAVNGRLVLVKDDAKGVLFQLVDGRVVAPPGRSR